MSVTHHNSLNGRRLYSQTEDYQVITEQGNQYEIVYSEYASIRDTKLYIYRLAPRMMFFQKREELASFSYNNSGTTTYHDSKKLDSAIRKKASYSDTGTVLLSDMNTIAHVIAQALEINEVATIDIMRSFDKSSWDMKAEALLALRDIIKKNEQREKSFVYPEDNIMETKLRALQAYHDILDELPTGNA